ncbi:MAG: MBL fold metallo-hydrolase [Treponema sp.]|jgi:flavorubredoxin|nr:MBL fold metallo-hydrolase [Treponema sp.]
MHRYINCIAHNSSEGNLLTGKERSALFDCGMAFCAKDTIQKVKNALGNRPLDYIFITHTHYDHTGALPYFREEWPQLRLAAAESGAAVLLKDTPRKLFRKLSSSAALVYNVKFDIDYDDDAFHADIIIKDKDIIPLGGLSVEALETPGHTRDSVSYFIPELELLFMNETPGSLMPDGNAYPCYLTSYTETINSINKCRRIKYKHLSLPHRGVVGREEADVFFDKVMAANIACYNFISDMKEKNLREDEMLDLYFQKYGSDVILSYQPKEAFILNARATIACTLRELVDKQAC